MAIKISAPRDRDFRFAVKSLQENIDTTTSGGKLIFHIFSALAEFERDLITERTQAGLKAARSRGRLGGRPPLLKPAQVKKMLARYDEQSLTVEEICKIFNISRSSFYNYLNKRKEEQAAIQPD